MDHPTEVSRNPDRRRTLRLWPAWILLGIALGVILFAQLQESWPFQRRNLVTLGTVVVVLPCGLIWWMLGSGIRWKTRWKGLGWIVLVAGILGTLFRIQGVSGDFVPIIAFRWSLPQRTGPAMPQDGSTGPILQTRADFPQFLGPTRDGQLPGPLLATNWTTQPPRLLWRRPIGAAWSGFAIVGTRALTQEQQGPDELVTAYDLETGRPLWAHTNLARYDTTIAGEGPRATPTVVSNRVYTLGATGILDCLDLETGRRIWTRSLTQDGGRGVPEWGYSGSPWSDGMLVVVQAGGGGKGLIAYRADSGEPAWSGGDSGLNYASPFRADLAGQSQFLIFGGRSLTAQDPTDGHVLWNHPFGEGMPLVANPIVVSSNRVLITAGYNVGAELLEIPGPGQPPVSIWKTKRLKAKFANPVRRGDVVYGLDDGILVGLDLKEGSQLWKEGRYGHGQGLWIGDVYLLMTESGKLVLLQPNQKGANELGSIPVFDAKTWNPIALAGDRLLVRNDREAVAWVLPLRTP